MALEQLDMESGLNKEDYAIQLLKTWEPLEGYYLGFSGGVDSQIIYDLAKRAKVKFDAHYNVSPIDPPQVYKFIRDYYPDVIWDYHAKGFWKLVVKNDLPLRIQRWCCRIIKEVGGDNRVVVVGNRADESTRRKHQCFIDVPNILTIKQKNHNRTILRPILKFTNFDRWQYMLKYKLVHNPLYDMGYERVGCVLCPYSSDKDKQIKDFPKIVNLWKLACDKIVQSYKDREYLTKRGKPMVFKPQTGEELFNWWVYGKRI